MIDDLMSIGKIAKKSGLEISTIRYYEQKGLIPSPIRSPSGYRKFKPETISRLRFIVRAKDLGFTLSEIAEILALKNPLNSNTCVAVKHKMEEKANEIESKIQDLRLLKEALLKLAVSCNGSYPMDECPILDALNTRD